MSKWKNLTAGEKNESAGIDQLLETFMYWIFLGYQWLPYREEYLKDTWVVQTAYADQYRKHNEWEGIYPPPQQVRIVKQTVFSKSYRNFE